MKPQTFLASILLGLSALGLSGCYDAPAPPPPQKAAFKYTPLYLNVAYVDITEEYKTSGAAPYVEQYFPTPPAVAMKQWVDARIRPVGRNRYLQVIIKDASVKEIKLPITKGIKGAFTNDQSHRYDARMEIEMRVYGPVNPLSEASLSISANRSATIAENASADAREKLFNKITAELMEMVNAELEKNIFAYFNRYIDYNYNASPVSTPGQ